MFFLIVYNVILLTKHDALYLKKTSTLSLCNNQIILMDVQVSNEMNAFPLSHFLIKTHCFSCRMTNYVFQVTNHLIKTYKRLNTVWPKWRLLSWISLRGGTGFSEKLIPNHPSTLNITHRLFTVVILNTSSG